jgi:flagellar motor switch/type III secretory pathway protein FliN
MPRRIKRQATSDSEDSHKFVKKVKRKKTKTVHNKATNVEQPKSSALLCLMVNMPVDVLLEVGPTLPFLCMDWPTLPDIQTS